MNDVDEMIRKTLDEQDRAVWAELGDEPGFFKQALGLFRGRLGWMMWLVMSVQLGCFAVAIWAIVELVASTEAVTAIKWGVLVVVLVQLITFLRGFMGSHFEANRVLREIALLQLQVGTTANEKS
jgi:hypothetical protein